ncbi:MAG: hypothetical protein ACRC92_02645 [Peptostreptococcaceae bacterium]
MLRFNRNRKKPTKGKHSDPNKTMDKVPSKQYEENYNEVILNDLVPEEKRSEFGLESDTPKNNQKSNSKKSGGLKLNLGLSGKKNKPSKDANKESINNKQENKAQSHKKEAPDNKEHTESTAKKSKAKPEQNKSKQSKTNKSKNNQSKNNKPTDESTSKGKGSNKNNSKGSNKTTKQTKGQKAKKSSIDEIIEENEINIEDVTDNTIELEHETKKNVRPVVNPKRRRRPEAENNDTLRSDEVQKEVEAIEDDNIENSDSIGFRNKEEKEVEVEEVKSKFEDLIWSEDKFPKK